MVHDRHVDQSDFKTKQIFGTIPTHWTQNTELELVPRRQFLNDYNKRTLGTVGYSVVL